MEANSIFKQLKELGKRANSSKVFNVIPLPAMPHKLGVSVEGYPIFFVSTQDVDAPLQGIIRDMLTVEYNIPCTIVEGESIQQTDYFSIICLRALHEPLQVYFIEIFLMILQKIPSQPSKRELSIEIENLITIFSALNKPPRKKIQGLWAELLVIEKSKFPQDFIRAWHESPEAKYDFTMGKDKIEVKSTSSEDRIHHFSLDQLNPSENSNLLIASVIVRESGQCLDGLSVNDLYNQICTKITEVEIRIMLYAKVTETIGSNFAQLENTFFDYIGASDSLKFYNYLDIPHISKKNIPQHVSDIKFSSDLSHLIDIRNSNTAFDISLSPLYQNIL